MQKDIENIEQELQSFIDEKFNLDGALETIASILEQSFRTNIEQGGRVGNITGEKGNVFSGGNSKFTPLSDNNYISEGDILKRSGNLIRSIYATVDYAYDTIKFGSNLPYSRIHQLGGKIKTKITPKSRKFFWAMFYKTGNDMFKGMALTKKEYFIINIPARPFLTISPETIEDIKETLADNFNS